MTMTPEEKKQAIGDAQRLLTSDGPHLRAWLLGQRDEFVGTVHRVAKAMLEDHSAAAYKEPLAEPAPPAPASAEAAPRGGREEPREDSPPVGRSFRSRRPVEREEG
jgi:hypothetical protein